MTPSRRKDREEKFYSSANYGRFETNRIYLYKSEERSLIKDGFTVKRYGNNKKGDLPSKVSWRKAFKDEIPQAVFKYINGYTNIFPEVSNYAQKLYVIAARHQADITAYVNE